MEEENLILIHRSLCYYEVILYLDRTEDEVKWPIGRRVNLVAWEAKGRTLY